MIGSPTGNWKYWLDESGDDPQIRLEHIPTEVRISEAPSIDPTPRWPAGSAFKKIHQLSISNKTLIIENRPLELHRSGTHSTLILRSKMQERGVVCTRYTGKNSFAFDDGSTVMLNENGMLCLESSDKNIPPFFIPVSLDFSLACASREHFAGSEYFRVPDLQGQKVIPVDQFYNKYVNGFIERVLKVSHR